MPFLILFYLLVSILITFLFRSENRKYPLISVSLLLISFISLELLGVLLLLSFIDVLNFQRAISHKASFYLGIVIIVLAFYVFSIKPVVVDLVFLSFNLLSFSLPIIFFNRLNDYLYKNKFEQISDIFFSNLFFPRLFTPVISKSCEERRLLINEMHFEADSLKSGGKNLFVGFFVFFCIFMPGARYVESIENVFLQTLSKGLLFTSFIYSIYDIGAGCLEVFSYRVFRNFNSPFASSGVLDFWKRWCVTFYNFSKSIQEKFFKKSNSLIAVFIAMTIQFIFFHSMLIFEKFSLSMGILFLITTLFTPFRFFKRLVHKNKIIGLFLRGISTCLLLLSFGFSFNYKIGDGQSPNLDIGSGLIFFTSCLILFLYHYLQTKDRSILSFFPKSKTFIGGLFILYIMMFGEFL